MGYRVRGAQTQAGIGKEAQERRRRHVSWGSSFPAAKQITHGRKEGRKGNGTNEAGAEIRGHRVRAATKTKP